MHIVPQISVDDLELFQLEQLVKKLIAAACDACSHTGGNAAVAVQAKAGVANIAAAVASSTADVNEQQSDKPCRQSSMIRISAVASSTG